LQRGNRIGGYEIVAPLGAGGMGEVYRAHDSKLRRDVAIKVLPQALAADPDRLARLTREARMLAALNHPNIAAIYGLDDSSGVTALVMELVEGQSLAAAIAQAGRSGMPYERVLPIVRQLAAALDAAHDKAITHRDLKPANVALAADGTVKVLDFGLATLHPAAAAQVGDAATITALSQPGTVAGTAAYMSPEQARGADVDKRADIWAFGCVVYEMLTGLRAFDGPSSSDQIAAVLTRDPDWDALPATVPMALRRLLMRCLEKDPKRRLRDIGDVDALLGDPLPATAGVERSRWLPWAVTALALVVAATLALQRPRTSAAPPAAAVRFQIPTGMNLAESQQFSLSPDGRRLVFAGAGADGVMRLWVRSLDSLETRPLAGTDTDVVDLIPPMFWSPDSRFVAYDNRGQLKRLDLSGGAPQVICAPPGFAIGGSWNRDDVILVGNVSGGIARCPATGGAATIVTTVDASREEDSHLLPTFLPDGRHFLYLAASRTKPENTAIYFDTIDGGPSRPVRRLVATTGLGPAQFVADPSGTSGAGYMVFGRGETLFAQRFDPAVGTTLGDAVPLVEHVSWYRDGSNFSTSANGTLVYRATSRPMVLTWFDRHGTAVERVSQPGQFLNVALSPNGTQALAARESPQRQPDQDIWLFDLKASASRRLTFDPLIDETPLWFPNGLDVLFRHGQDLAVMRNDGSSRERTIYASPRQKFPTDISPDGGLVLFQEQTLDPVKKTDIFVVRASGGAAVPVVEAPLEQSQAVFSPDGRAIAYVSNESGVSDVFVQSFSPPGSGGSRSGGRVQVSNSGGATPHWRRDGKELLYLAPDGALMAADCVTADAPRCSAPHALFKVPGVQSGWGVSPDGARFLFAVSSGTSEPEPFSVILNWTATLPPARP